MATGAAAVLGGGRMIRYLRMFRMFALSELQFELEYRLNFIFVLLEMVLVVGTSVGAVLIMFAHTTNLNGWTLPQMLVLIGVFYLIQGGNALLFEPSFQRLMEHVRLGTLDYHLLKPVNTQFIVSVRHMRVVRIPDVLLGFIVMGVGLAQLGARVGPLDALLFALALLCGLALVYSLLLVLVTLSFWFVRVENLLTIFWAFTDAGRFPVDLYPGWLRFTLSTVVPIGIAVTAPSQAIASKIGPVEVALLAAGTVVAFTVASAFWRLGLRNYTGASA
ncbi:MAG: multidrug transporter [Chloroflexi bacterium]|nr:MAG: multidrug transporter [Chloroflexota bacterium]TMB97695.1 MAG: multidrug transporter [Chloroflexota bacterium]TMC31396.1 MAG: multidrug transporter [Chloroflexota bacterium]TMC35588.1 MAG: multidrug transporter [Chloroflexota bacterium]TMC55906.1 MAG: multidrug transporter [Chloroflexota bacterium]